jgi:YHS domain-containing protein
VVRFLLIAILLLLVARAFWKVMDGVIAAAGGGTPRSRGAKPAVRLVRDPVCGTHIPQGSAIALTRGGATHHFCSQECRDEFRKRS